MEQPNKDTNNTTNNNNTEQMQNEQDTIKETISKKLVFIQYRGKVTENFAKALHHCGAPCTIVMTLRKLRTVLPSLKPSIEKTIRSGIVYRIVCPRCKACYVGCTIRHLKTRSSEHRTQKNKTMGKHTKSCQSTITDADFDILASTSRGQDYLETLEALYIRQYKPKINTKDEYRSRELSIKLVP